MTNVTKKVFVVDECEVTPIDPIEYCPLHGNVIEACDSDNRIILTSGATAFNKDISLDGAIIKYSGTTNLEGKFLSGSTTGFVLADIDDIKADGSNSYITEDITSTLEIGGIDQSETITSGTTLTDFVKKLIRKVFYPNFTNPSFSLSQNQGSLREIAQSLNVTLTFAFNRGSILGNVVNDVWNPSAVQNPRAGVAISYNIAGVVVGTNSRVVNNYSVIQGINQFNATVTYDEGPQPLDSSGVAYSTPLPAATSPNQTASFEGVYPIYGTTSNITTATKQPLVSMINGNNIQISLVAEVGGNKQFFEVPNAWTATRPLTSVQFFNTVSGQFDTTNQISTFTASAVTEIVQGQTVNYTRYTNNALNRGALLIRLIF